MPEDARHFRSLRSIVKSIFNGIPPLKTIKNQTTFGESNKLFDSSKSAYFAEGSLSGFAQD